MHTPVTVEVRGDGYAVEFQRQQWLLLFEVTFSLLRVVDEPAYARLLVGAAREEALAVFARGGERMVPGSAGQGEQRSPVRVELTAHELHVLYATLACAYMATDSHKVFHVDTGYYLENVRDVASALENGIARATEAGG